MTRHSRPTPLPPAMQGRWIDGETGSTDLVIDGFDVIYRGAPVAHDWFVAGDTGGALCVDLGVDDPARADSFERENLTNLVIDPDCEFHAYNTRFAIDLERAP